MNKQDIINWFRDSKGAMELDLVDDTSDAFARHVCVGGDKVFLIPKQQSSIATPRGNITIEYYQCEVCGKIIMNRNFI